MRPAQYIHFLAHMLDECFNKDQMLHEEDEQPSDDDNYTMFIGAKDRHDNVRTPSVDQPLFLATKLDYALEYTDGHTALTETEGGYVQVVKFPKKYLAGDKAMLDLVSDMKHACKVLGFPDVMTSFHMHCGGMQWYVSVKVGMFIHKLISRLGQQVFEERKRGEDIISKYKRGKDKDGNMQSLDILAWQQEMNFKDFEYVDKEYLDANAPKLTGQSIVQFIDWVNDNQDVSKLLPKYASKATPDSTKDSYKLTAALYFKPIAKLGYKAFANVEGNSWAIGIIDSGFTDICTCNCYSKDDPKLDQYR